MSSINVTVMMIIILCAVVVTLLPLAYIYVVASGLLLVFLTVPSLGNDVSVAVGIDLVCLLPLSQDILSKKKEKLF